MAIDSAPLPGGAGFIWLRFEGGAQWRLPPAHLRRPTGASVLYAVAKTCFDPFRNGLKKTFDHMEFNTYTKVV
jgi:hypothetical protein